MAEATAGIGEAGALVNKATAPHDMAITKGLMYREQNDLKKAAAEAQKLAKQEAMQEKIAQHLYVSQPKLKYKSSQDELHNALKKEYADLALSGGNGVDVWEKKANLQGRVNDILRKDNLKWQFDPSNRENANVLNYEGAKEALDKGEESFTKYVEGLHPLQQRHISVDENGDIIADKPKKLDLNKLYDQQVADLPPDILDMKKLALGQIKITKKIPEDVLIQKAYNLAHNDETYSKNLDFNKEFQKFYDNFEQTEGKKLELQGVSQPEIEQAAKNEFTYQQLKKYNNPEYSLKGESYSDKFGNNTTRKTASGGWESSDGLKMEKKKGTKYTYVLGWAGKNGKEGEVKDVTLTDPENQEFVKFNTIDEIDKMDDGKLRIKGTILDDGIPKEKILYNVSDQELSNNSKVPQDWLNEMPINVDVKWDKALEDFKGKVNPDVLDLKKLKDPVTGKSVADMTTGAEYKLFREREAKDKSKPATESHIVNKPEVKKAVKVKKGTNKTGFNPNG